MKWTEERTTLLAQLVDEGLSSTVIAERMGVSRNSVISKVHQQKLTLKLGQGRKPPKRKPPPKQWQLPPRKPLPMRISTPVPGPVAFMELRLGQCKWPLGAFFCGVSAIAGKPYCLHHMKLGIQGSYYAQRQRDEGSQASGEGGSPATKAAA